MTQVALKCTNRSYKTEAIAKRCLWAIGQQRRINVDRMAAMRCRGCGMWRVGRVKR
jgi:hypothetical protein